MMLSFTLSSTSDRQNLILLQVLLLFALNFGMIAFISIKESFKELINTIGQIFCELVLLLANICVFILAIFGLTSSGSNEAIGQLSRCIIVLNFILLFGCAIFLVIGMGQMLIKSYQGRKKKASKKALSSVKFDRSVSNQSAQTFVVVGNSQDSQNISEFDNNNSSMMEIMAWSNSNNLPRGILQNTLNDFLERSGTESLSNQIQMYFYSELNPKILETQVKQISFQRTPFL